MRQPIVILNFKAYPEAIGKNAIKLAKICEDVVRVKNTEIMIAVQPSDIFQITSKFSIKVLAQHVDADYGKFTGSINVKAVKDAKAYGTLLNHAEKKIDYERLKATIEECKKMKLKVIVCASDIKEAEDIAKLKPEFIAFEIPELIGTEKSITKEAPESVKNFVEIARKNKIIPLCGAGINSREDVETAIKLGTDGVLLSSAFVKAKNHKKFLMDLIP
ncbi:MAG: triose-phosphate isomerase [Candidatus Aenigmatarchaeota archaeon]|nr:triose-phosphate isomerase [Candidatus Aenigmarchaeota archaeon]